MNSVNLNYTILQLATILLQLIYSVCDFAYLGWQQKLTSPYFPASTRGKMQQSKLLKAWYNFQPWTELSDCPHSAEWLCIVSTWGLCFGLIWISIVIKWLFCTRSGLRDVHQSAPSGAEEVPAFLTPSALPHWLSLPILVHSSLNWLISWPTLNTLYAGGWGVIIMTYSDMHGEDSLPRLPQLTPTEYSAATDLVI